MADGSSNQRDQARQPGSIEEHLAPLEAAAPERSSGRIRSLAEARIALKVPTSAEPEVLKAWGAPTDFQLVAFPVADPDQPHLIAEFAALCVIRRQGRELIPAPPGSRLRLREKSDLLWIVYGSIVRAADTTLVLESLGIGPAFDGQLSHQGDDIARGITAQLLRLLSPARLLQGSVEQLLRARHQLEAAQQHGSPVSPDQTAAIAKRYIILCQDGLRHPLPQIAREFGISRTQARDRIHKARNQGYLKPGRQGRVSAEPGPRLKDWNPPGRCLVSKRHACPKPGPRAQRG